MLYLVFQIGVHRYAIASREVEEVLPLIELNVLAHAPAVVAGIFLYRGAPVPVVDLSQLIQGRPAERKLSTRLVIVRPSNGAGSRLLGLLAEKATDTIRREAGDFVASGALPTAAGYLGPVTTDARGLIHRLDVSVLITLHDDPSMKTAEHAWASPILPAC